MKIIKEFLIFIWRNIERFADMWLILFLGFFSVWMFLTIWGEDRFYWHERNDAVLALETVCASLVSCYGIYKLVKLFIRAGKYADKMRKRKVD